MHGTATAPMPEASRTEAPPFEILTAIAPRGPVIVASPHSGDCYPSDFIAASRLDPLSLRKSEDCFVHEIFAEAPSRGAPLIHARFPRAYLDLNREPYELDPLMFEDALPPYVNRNSARVAVGLGTIARVVADGQNIYRGKLRFAEAEARIERLYKPYHAALSGLVAETRAASGYSILVDAHSMPSVGARGDGRRRVDIVLGDRLGTSCHPRVTAAAEKVLNDLGYAVIRNAPYAGGYTTGHYGRPAEGTHCLQIEVNRALYMDERTLTRKPFLAELRADMGRLVAALSALDPATLAIA